MNGIVFHQYCYCSTLTKTVRKRRHHRRVSRIGASELHTGLELWSPESLSRTYPPDQSFKYCAMLKLSSGFVFSIISGGFWKFTFSHAISKALLLSKVSQFFSSEGSDLVVIKFDVVYCWLSLKSAHFTTVSKMLFRSSLPISA